MIWGDFGGNCEGEKMEKNDWKIVSFIQQFFLRIFNEDISEIEGLFWTRDSKASRTHNFSLKLVSWRLKTCFSHHQLWQNLLMANSGSTWGWKLLGGVKNFRNWSLGCGPMPYPLTTFSSLIMMLKKMISISHQQTNFFQTFYLHSLLFLAFFLHKVHLDLQTFDINILFFLLKARN